MGLQSKVNPMPDYTIYVVIGAFVVVAIVLAIVWRGATLDKLPMLSGEQILFDEVGIRVEQKGGPETAWLVGAHVRVTNQRVIIGQKMAFGKTVALRHVITYATPSHAGTELSESLKSGYVIADIQPDDMQLGSDPDEKNKPTLIIPLDGSILTKGSHVKVFVADPAKYHQALFGNR